MTNVNSFFPFLLLIENLKGLMVITMTLPGVTGLRINGLLAGIGFNGPRRSAAPGQFINQLGLKSLIWLRNRSQAAWGMGCVGCGRSSGSA